MNYRETLNKANEIGINPSDLEIAFSLDALLEQKVTDEEFERMCYLINEAYLKDSNCSACFDDYTSALLKLLEDDDDYTVLNMKKLDEIDRWQILEEVYC